MLRCVVSTLFLLKPFEDFVVVGYHYARTLGTDLSQIRLIIMLTSGISTAASTLFTGPIVFVGMVISNLSRMLFKSVDHQILFPYILFLGTILMSLCLILSRFFPGSIVPINIITVLLGAPFVMYPMLMRSKYLN